jgi:hypothetical protein
MNGLDERRVARERLPCGGLIPPEERSDVVLWRLQRGKVAPRQIILEVASTPFNGVELGAIRWQAHEVSVVRQGEPLGGMGPTMVHEEAMQAVSEGLGEGSAAALEQVGMERRQFPEEARARGGCHGAIDGAPVEDVWHRANGLHPTRGEAPPADGQEAKAAVVVTAHPNRVGVRGGNRLLELGLTGGLECGDGLRMLLCDGAGPR